MQAEKGIEMLKISAVMRGKTETVYPTLLRDAENTILVDTGFPGQLPLFREALDKAGIPLERLNKLIITHQDIDHIGSLPDILNALPHKAEVLANELEKPYIQGEKQILKITSEAIAHIMSTLPPEVPEEWKNAFQRTLENPPKAPVDTTIVDGEELPYGGGLIVIDTPGHTPGHISLYHKPSRTLIAGDAMIVADGQLLEPVPEYCVDVNLALKSLQKFIPYDIEKVICYHGGLYQGDANRRIAELAAGQA